MTVEISEHLDTIWILARLKVFCSDLMFLYILFLPRKALSTDEKLNWVDDELESI
jgi:hypothetical protein